MVAKMKLPHCFRMPQRRSAISDRNRSERSLDQNGHPRLWSYFRDAALWLRSRSEDLFHGGRDKLAGQVHSVRRADTRKIEPCSV